METLKIVDARCFRTVSSRIRPLTLLVGENSTGKTTYLALLRIAWDVASGNINIDFNEDPFRLGAYDQIAHYHGGQGKRVTEFGIGASFKPTPRKVQPTTDVVRVDSVFRSDAGHPRMASWRVVSPDTDILFSLGPHESMRRVEGSLFGRPLLADVSRWDQGALAGTDAWSVLQTMALTGWSPRPKERTTGEREVMRVFHSVRHMRIPGERPTASAPIRTGPIRTYDPLRETPQPAGGHVPMILARLAASEPKQWQSLSQALAAFGEACGLFRGVEVHRAKKEKVSEPFQIMVDIEGQRDPANLVDVGYGVSQVLPVLVDALLQPSGWFLWQQPEVHLHPRAQAELGSFLGAMVAAGRRFAVETHSDFLLDRICVEVREGKSLKPDDVVILFFERCGPQVKIHEIEIDGQGNVLGAPETYRDFFRREQSRFLGLKEW